MEDFDVKRYVTDKELVYFGLMALVSFLVYLVLIVSIVGIIYVLFFALFFFVAQGLAVGHIRQNAVKITEYQFGDIYEKVQEYSQKMKIKEIPEVYLMQSGGILNAFATRFLFKDIVVIYSDILEMAYEQGENAVNFIIAHELAHVKRKHLSKRKYIVCGEIIPFLGLAYSRACESTCDRIAAALIDGLPVDGLLVLAAGKKLYKKVDANLFITNAETTFWGWFAEICSTHPSLVSRVENLSSFRG